MANFKELAERIKAEEKAKLARSTITLKLPVYGGRYSARFGVLSKDALEAFEAAMEATEDQTSGEATIGQYIADACRCILAKDGKRWEVLEHEPGRPVRFDAEFAEALDLEAAPDHDLDSAAGVVIACWVNDAGELVRGGLVAFWEKLLAWSKDPSAAVEDEVVEGQHGGLK